MHKNRKGMTIRSQLALENRVSNHHCLILAGRNECLKKKVRERYDKTPLNKRKNTCKIMCTTFRCINSLSFFFLLTASLSVFNHFRLWFADWITCCSRLKNATQKIIKQTSACYMYKCQWYTAICLSLYAQLFRILDVRTFTLTVISWNGQLLWPHIVQIRSNAAC